MTDRTIEAATLREWLADHEELALLDVRPSEVVGYEPFLGGAHVPADRVEAEIDRLVPRKPVRTVLVDDGGETARALAARLAARGRAQAFALAGGIPAWTRAGGYDQPIFDLTSGALTEAILGEGRTAALTAGELRRLQDDGADVVVLDTRTLPEFEAGHVPGAVGVPGGEVLLRFADAVPSEETHVVVSCAGLPRAVIGAQTLIDAGVPNRVSYLHDGTTAWVEEGLELETGRTSVYGPAGEAARRSAAERVAALATGEDLPRIDAATAARWAADPSRTTYLLDVRTPEEHAAHHVPGSASAEGGQLLAVSSRSIAVRGARVVLIDDLTGARAAVAAHWLRRRGHEIALLLLDFLRA